MKAKLFKFATVIRLIALLTAIVGTGIVIHVSAQAADGQSPAPTAQKAEKDDDANEPKDKKDDDDKGEKEDDDDDK